jgi:hypothetical protein
MSDYVSLTGEVVFNHVTKPDNYMGASTYKLTIALDDDGKKVAEKNGLATKEYNGLTQLTSKRKVDFGEPKVYNADKELVTANHLSLYGDKVTMQVKKGKAPYDAYTYLEKVRVEEKAQGSGDYDPAEF